MQKLLPNLQGRLDPPSRLHFVRDRLGIHPDPIQTQILARNIRRGILNCTRQWGKSTITAAMAVHQAYTVPESLTLVVSPSGRQSAEFVRKAANFATRLGIRPRGDGDNAISLLFPNGARIVGVPESEDKIRGFSSVSLILIDEASRVSDELYTAVRPMLAVGDGHLWLMSTPNGQRGFFWETWSKGSDTWTRFSIPATECPRITKKFLDEERATHGERSFRQEYLCEFTDANDAVFSRKLIEEAFGSEVKPLDLPRRW
jgi:hypothetical protein